MKNFEFKPIKPLSLELESKTENKTETLCMEVAELVTELMNAATSFHKLHLKVTGLGSFAQHKAIQEIYESLPDSADTIAEEFQGAKGELLKYVEIAPKTLNTKEEGLMYADSLKTSITELQNIMPYSEIVNQLDNVKSSLNNLKYRLLFLS